MIILTCTFNHQIYNKFKLASCSSCGACPKQGNPFFLHSPDPSTVSHYLSDTNLGSNTCLSNSITYLVEREIQIQIKKLVFVMYLNKYCSCISNTLINTFAP